MTENSASDAAASQRKLMLDRIATLLDVPVSTFSEPTACDLSQGAELIDLSLKIDSPGLENVIAMMRDRVSRA